MRILLVCERSGGHIFPALVLGRKLRQNKGRVSFFVSSGVLKSYVIAEKFDVYGRNFLFRNLVLECFWRFFEAVYLLFKIMPQRVIGFGGRDSFFLLFLASLAGIDTAIYEPNMELGKANKLLSIVVKNVFCGFAPLEKAANGESNFLIRFGFTILKTRPCKIKTVGIPLREGLIKISKEQACRKLGLADQPVIFCCGGSQGSSFINKNFIAFAQNSRKHWQAVHITGQREYLEISRLYNKIDRGKFVRGFFYPIELFYSAADIVVCRAGASTLGEISYYQKPAVLIPYPGAGGHQVKNAFFFRARKAACVFSQNDFSFRAFSRVLENLLSDSGLRAGLAANISKIKLGVTAEEFYNNVR